MRGLPGYPGCDISIHAPREGSDRPGHANGKLDIYDFNPRSPRGERPAT